MLLMRTEVIFKVNSTWDVLFKLFSRFVITFCEYYWEILSKYEQSLDK